MKRIQVLSALACEYVSQPTSGKFTILNAYAGNILLRDLPGALGLAFYLEFPPARELPEILVIEVFHNKRAIARIEAHPDRESNETTVVPTPPFPFQFERDGTISVVGSGKGFSRTTLLKKTVSKAPVG